MHINLLDIWVQFHFDSSKTKILDSGCQYINQDISKYVTCRKYQGAPSSQKIANVPVVRLKSDDPPFSRTGTDFFGPFEVKQGRSVVKRYGVISTCMATRAVHLAMELSLDTDSSVNAVRRFIARRRHPCFIITDNRTNFVATERDLREEIQSWNQQQIQDLCYRKTSSGNLTLQQHPISEECGRNSIHLSAK
jgi:hypothetical protein